jgi:hypothetical protein
MKSVKPSAKSVKPMKPPKNLPPAWLLDVDRACEYARRNAGIDADEREWNVIYDAVADYVGSIQGIVSHGSVRLYRVVRVPTTQDVVLSCLGKSWSMEASGAGAQISSPYGKRAVYDVMIVGEVQARYIDWSFGFFSYLAYPQQQEISLLRHAPVSVLQIGDTKFDPPIMGSTGTSDETWDPTCRD